MTNKAYNGNLGGRQEADIKCQSDINVYNVYTLRPSCTAHAFISVSSQDQAKDIIQNYSLPPNSIVRGPFKEVIAINLSDFLNG